jgi:hypothetical protein
MFTRAKYKDSRKLDINSIEDPVGMIKYDGGNYFAEVQQDGSLKFHSRRESVAGGFPERSDKLPHFADVRIPEFAGHVFNVELIHTGHDKENVESHPEVSGILNSLPERAAQTQKETGPVRAAMFDVIHPHIDTYGEKLQHLAKIEKAINKPNLIFVPKVKIGLSNISSLIDETEKIGREGVIVTSLTAPEKKNTRLKIKHLNTYNLRVIGIIQERDILGNLKNSAGALELADASGRVVGKVGTGFSKKLREEIHKDPKSWMNRIIQVKAFPSVGTKLRMPVYNGDADGELDLIK